MGVNTGPPEDGFREEEEVCVSADAGCVGRRERVWVRIDYRQHFQQQDVSMWYLMIECNV